MRFFTLITSGLMIFIMGVYNVAVHTGGLKYATFAYAAHPFLPEWIIGFLLAFFIAGGVAKCLAFRKYTGVSPSGYRENKKCHTLV